MKDEASTIKNRDYSSISPSARSLLLLKGLTDIPFALEAARLISQPEPYIPDFSKGNIIFWARVLHFEARYKSINQLLWSLTAKNILELSSGFSFRGLDTVIDNDIHYIDTDLPNVIDIKQKLEEALISSNFTPKGKLETLPLNALNETDFLNIINHFPEGEIAIVNEGLLVYLDIDEKRKLCQNIRTVLQKRGGYWITADIYIKSERKMPELRVNDQLDQFLKEHNTERNKFNSFAEAEFFFKSEGLVIDQEAEPGYHSASSLKYLMAVTTEEQRASLSKSGRTRATWRLKLAE
ncbi:hypothetical protein SNE25_24905 [Mucilaginibacter sabulilitoris]|uniref:Leucine carboxyl methyltransferase n=1 Tax=Mucilaginibacter sabulilitoris TaxID=1173583 RepID=A0ABZ0THC7_9SPHI|nr:hypothetical protein [Mucilaginibacter sabulilitoris]WPU92567.1 hypothetical protein SNE25_24905 [Mucilaginibacter sabulilitoris]